ncbi:MAG TPA: hypothetical protein VN751_11080 [Solirubrobacteraceae bacterium]|nr:hypothetical protein [Solirubrobacteraceae bacterium]
MYQLLHEHLQGHPELRPALVRPKRRERRHPPPRPRNADRA